MSGSVLTAWSLLGVLSLYLSVCYRYFVTFSNCLFSGYGLVLEGCLFLFSGVAQKVLNLRSWTLGKLLKLLDL